MKEHKPNEPRPTAGTNHHASKHAPKGLYQKFKVTYADGSPLSPDDIVFVMMPTKDPAALAAVETYARLTKNEELAQDLYELLSAIMFRKSQQVGGGE